MQFLHFHVTCMHTVAQPKQSMEIYSTMDNRVGGGGEVLSLTIISLSRGGFSSVGGCGWIGIAASVLLGVNFEPCEGRGGRLSSLVT